jgi:outer membrane protein OmpA-like peptidoglycan-associated protein
LLAGIFCGTACASDGEVAAARAGEEQWERVPVIAAGADRGSPAAPDVASEDLRFAPGTVELSKSMRADLDRLAARLRADSACLVDLRPGPSADQRLVRKRAAAVRGYLSRQPGITGSRISEPGSAKSGAIPTRGDGARCVLVARLG